MSNESRERVRLGIAGLGRSGWGIHANAADKLSDSFNVVAVCDPDTSRQEEAVDRFDCMAYNNIDDLVATTQSRSSLWPRQASFI